MSAVAAQGSIEAVRKSADRAAAEAEATGGTSAAAARTAAGIVSRFLIDYQGDSAEGKPDVVFWVSDRDLVDPSKESMEVRILHGTA